MHCLMFIISKLKLLILVRGALSPVELAPPPPFTFETGSYYETRLTLNSERSTCLCFLIVRIKVCATTSSHSPADIPSYFSFWLD